jgi:macrolide-specific efflux system membrane fusion protein
MISLKEKLSHKKLRLIIVIALILAASAGFFLKKRSANQITYRENKAEIATIEIKVLATGTVQPQNRLEIKPPIPGRVEKVMIEEGQKVKRGQILAWMSSTERAALLDAARSKGVEELKKWEEIYPPTPILAPLSGTIVLKSVEQGETFTSVDSLMAMSDRLTVKSQVDETDIASIQLNQEAEIILDAYPDQKIPAQVSKIAFEATTVNNVTTYIVDVLPKAVPSFMRSGMTANVTFVVNSKKDVLAIPSEALKTKDGASMVLIRDQKGREVEKAIEVGVNNGKQVEIISGLTLGEVVLTRALELEDKKSSNPFAPARGGNPRGSKK